MVVVTFASTLGYCAMNGFLSPYLRASGLTVVTVGLLYSLSSAIEVPATMAGGIIADRVGRRPILVAGRLLRAIGWLTLLLWTGSNGVVAGAICIGLGGMAISSYRALVAESAAPERRASAFALVGAAESVVGLAVPPLVGVVAVWLGLKAVLVAASILSAAGVVTAVLAVGETLHGGTGPEAKDLGHPPLAAGWRFMASKEGRGAALMAATCVVSGFGAGVLPPVLGLYVLDRFGVSYAGLGVIAVAGSVGAILGQLAGGYIADRIGHARLMVMCFATTVVAWALVTLAGQPLTYSLLLALAYLLETIPVPAWEAIAANAAPRRLRGSVAGVYATMAALGGVAGAAVSGLAYSVNIMLPWYLVALGDLLLLVLTWTGSRAGLRGYAAKIKVEAGPGEEVSA